MKKIILIFAILNCFIFGADSFIKENDIFIQGGKAYLLATDKEVTGVLLKEKDGFATYSTYSTIYRELFASSTLKSQFSRVLVL